MPIWATCHRSNSAGFTLFEILIVLVLIGLAMSLAMPRLGTLLARTEHAGQHADIILQIDNLGYRAWASGRNFTLQGQIASDTLPIGVPLKLAPGWTLRLPKAIRFTREGFCSGGTVEIVDPAGAVTDITLIPPVCHDHVAIPTS